MISLDSFLRGAINKCVNLKNSLARYLSRTVSKTNTPRKLSSVPGEPEIRERTLKERHQVRKSDSAILISSRGSHTRHVESAKAEALLEVDLPQHRIAGHFVEAGEYPSAENFQSLKTLVRNPAYTGPTAGKAVPDPIIHLSIMEPDSEAHKSFMSGWRKLVGPSKEKGALKQLDDDSRDFKLFLNEPDAADTPALPKLDQVSKTLAGYRSRLGAVSASEQKALEYFFTALELQIAACRTQINSQRKTVLTDFLINGNEFKRGCEHFKLNPRRDLSMAQLQSLQAQLEAAVADHALDTLPKLRRRCMTLMNQFLKNPGERREIRRYDLPSRVPPHKKIPTDASNIECKFMFDGDGITKLSCETFDFNFHEALIQELGTHWLPGTDLPRIPDLIVKAIDIGQKSASEMPKFMVISDYPEESDQEATREILKGTSLGKTSHLQSQTEGVDNFQRETHRAWGILCGYYAQPSDKAPSYKDRTRWMSLRQKINASLEEMGAKKAILRKGAERVHLQKAIQHLYIQREILDKLIDISRTH